MTFIRSKKRTKKQIHKAIRAQLQYVRQDIVYIESMVSQGIQLSEKQQKKFDVIKKVYEQQKYMYDNKTHSVADKIVNLSQSYVRPIVRGKAHANTEFGAKLHISLVDGYARIETLSFDAYNESCDFIDCVENYKEYAYPEKILVDKIYRNRETLSFCKDKGIRITGSALGRSKKDTNVSKEAKREEYKNVLWSYICNFPNNNSLNLNVDQASWMTRSILWLLNKYEVDGCKGQNYIVMPDADLLSVKKTIRYENMCQGAEEYELLCMLRKKNYEARKKIVSSIVTDRQTYETDIKVIEKTHYQLLELLG